MPGAPDYDVAIIGAGAAGLAAAAILRAAGRSCVLLESGARIGGRAHTVRPEVLGGARFDIGATWLHQTDRNPLASLAQARGIRLRPAHRGPRRLFVDRRPASDRETEAYDAAHAAWESRAIHRADGPDDALSVVAGTDDVPATNIWAANIENWEGAIIAAADADRLSLHDWRRNRLDESDLSPPDGLGTLLADLLGPLAGPVALGTPVDSLTWADAQICRLHTGRGEVTARAAIVTVSTGVLQSGLIAFDPPLPDATREAIDGLPMGLLNKLAIPAAGAARLGLEAETLLEHRLTRRGAPGMILSAWPDGLPYVGGFLGGKAASSLAGQPDRMLAEARTLFEELLGTAAGRALAPDRGFVTDWSSDANFAGAYAFCPPGRAGSRRRLAEPIGGRLLFAGEACRDDGLAGTVGGAVADGERAASWLLCHRFGVEFIPSLSHGFRDTPHP